MTFHPAEVRKLLYRLGFLEALRWNEDQLRAKAREIPSRFTAEQIPKRYQELYDKLSKFSRTGELIVFDFEKSSTKTKNNA